MAKSLPKLFLGTLAICADASRSTVGSAQDVPAIGAQMLQVHESTVQQAKETVTPIQECVPDAATFTFATATMSVNNLGDQGPGDGPPYIRYDNVGILSTGENFDMTVEVLNADYVALKPQWNGLNGHTGEINLKVKHEAKLKFTLVKHNTYDPVVIPAFYISVFDIDGSSTQEYVTVDGYDDLIIPDNPEYTINYTTTGAIMTSSHEGYYCDNPVDPINLEVVECGGYVVDQSKRAFQMLFKQKSSFELTFKVDWPRAATGNAERNLLFGGTTNLITPCEPPPTTTTTTFEQRPPPQPEHFAPLSKCSWTPVQKMRTMKDCTNSDIFEFKLGVYDRYVNPTYEPDVYGNDAHWRTFDAQRVGEGWTGSCVAWARTAGRTCAEWCDLVQGMRCVRGMDDAHHQTKRLTEWLSTKGYTAEGKYGGCTLMPAGYDRQSTEHNGCDQAWATQICACVEK